MFIWMQNILGEQYTKEIDRNIAQEIGKRFVSRSDFNAVNKEKNKLKKNLQELEKQLYDLLILSKLKNKF